MAKSKRIRLRALKSKQQALRISYEIVPGQHFAPPPSLVASSYRARAQAQQLAQQVFEAQILQKVGIPTEHTSGQVASGGWKGAVNPSGQIAVPAETDPAKLALCAALLGLIWRQDAVMISRLHPEGSRAAVLVARADGKHFTKSQIQKAYETLYNQDAGKDATVGFFEVDGSMVFINGGGDLTDDDFREVLRTLITRHLPGKVKLRHLRADMVLVSSNWSNGDGEDYRRTIRESGRPDLLHWVDDSARPQAEAFVADFDWKKGVARAQEDSS